MFLSYFYYSFYLSFAAFPAECVRRGYRHCINGQIKIILAYNSINKRVLQGFSGQECDFFSHV